MMCVNEILPPRPRFRWLFITRRLSATSLAGMSRTLVAVGTVRLASMFVTVRAAAPLSGTISSTAVSPSDAAVLALSAGAGARGGAGEAGGASGRADATGGEGAAAGALGALGATGALTGLGVVTGLGALTGLGVLGSAGE